MLARFQECDVQDLLVFRARSGDDEAFATCFRMYRPLIYAIAKKYFAPGADRDDLRQEATIGFFKAIRDYRADRGSFGTFVELCVQRQVITFIKSATRQKYSPLNQAASLDVPLFIDSSESLLSRLPAECSNWADEDLVHFIEELQKVCSDFECRVLSLYSSGYSYQEMAEITNTGYKSIDNCIWRVKVKAKRLLKTLPKGSPQLIAFGGLALA